MTGTQTIEPAVSRSGGFLADRVGGLPADLVVLLAQMFVTLVPKGDLVRIYYCRGGCASVECHLTH